jgi:hypothetical protein
MFCFIRLVYISSFKSRRTKLILRFPRCSLYPWSTCSNLCWVYPLLCFINRMLSISVMWISALPRGESLRIGAVLYWHLPLHTSSTWERIVMCPWILHSNRHAGGWVIPCNNSLTELPQVEWCGYIEITACAVVLWLCILEFMLSNHSLVTSEGSGRCHDTGHFLI